MKFKKRVRFIFGTDEETLWRCINRYKEKEETPTLGFSPDARFPLIYAEKGLLQLRLEGQNQTDVRLSGGSAFNAVPDMMFYDGVMQEELASKLDELGFAYEWKEDGIEIIGKAAHAMITEEGINAIARLCIALQPHRHRVQSHQFYRPGAWRGSLCNPHLREIAVTNHRAN